MNCHLENGPSSVETANPLLSLPDGKAASVWSLPITTHLHGFSARVVLLPPEAVVLVNASLIQVGVFLKAVAEHDLFIPAMGARRVA